MVTIIIVWLSEYIVCECSEDSSDEELEVDNTEPTTNSSTNPWLGQSGK